MESYQGVKFQYEQRNVNFVFNEKLHELNHWAVLFGQLGLAPVHARGAYGNLSYRTGQESFIISKTGMIPAEKLLSTNYSHVVHYDQERNIVYYDGESVPSSESILHSRVYSSFSAIHAIFHGHCPLFEKHNDHLDLPITRTLEPYGSQQLADSVIKMLNPERNFFLLKNHGFVVAGSSIRQCGETSLGWLLKLITILQKHAG
jgi:hypothetical protein